MLLRSIRWAKIMATKSVLEGRRAKRLGSPVEIKGHNAFGWLKTEAGVHRLVRISPFDSNARRHTSFAGVTVYPVVDDRIVVDIKEADVRTDTMRSGGAGGQHVNKTESAIRLTHIPTGIVVVCQNDRSQHRNRAQAWQMLRAKLYQAELKKREEQAAAEQAAKTDIGWGHQIRSYVLQYQMAICTVPLQHARCSTAISTTRGATGAGPRRAPRRRGCRLIGTCSNPPEAACSHARRR